MSKQRRSWRMRARPGTPQWRVSKRRPLNEAPDARRGSGEGFGVAGTIPWTSAPTRDFRKERTEKREIAIREQGPQRVRYKVTEPMLRLHFPGLFSPQIDALTRELTHRIDALRATIGAEVDERVSPQVQMLRAAHERLTSDVTRLAQSTDEGFTRLERRIYKIEQDRSK